MNFPKANITHNREVEQRYQATVIKILQEEKFENILRMPRLSLFDYEARRDGNVCYIELKTRSVGMAPFFSIRRSQFERLRELKKETGRNVYYLFVQGDMHKLVEIDCFPGDMKPFNVTVHGEAVPSVRFPARGEVLDEEKQRMITLRKQGLAISKIAETLKRSEVSIRKYLPLELRKGFKITRKKQAKEGSRPQGKVYRTKGKEVIKRYRFIIPYSQLVKVLQKDDEAFVEGPFRRATVWKAARRLSELVGRPVRVENACLRFEGKADIQGYSFSLEKQLRQKRSPHR